MVGAPLPQKLSLAPWDHDTALCLKWQVLLPQLSQRHKTFRIRYVSLCFDQLCFSFGCLVPMNVFCGTPSFNNSNLSRGSSLGPLVFLIYINDIVKNIGCSICLLANDTRLYIIVESPNGAAPSLNIDLNTISTWTDA